MVKKYNGLTGDPAVVWGKGRRLAKWLEIEVSKILASNFSST